MKNYCTALLLLLILAISQLSFAQAHKIKCTNMPGKSENIYLKMMDTMMQKMDGAPHVATFGNEFITQMIPHHQGALAMAAYEIKHGKNFKTRQLAKSIAAEQNSEIMMMQQWLSWAEPTADSVTREYRADMGKAMSKMMADMPGNDKLTDPDRAFKLVMIPHHRAAIDMAGVLLKYSHDKKILGYAAQLISNEQMEVEQMESLLK